MGNIRIKDIATTAASTASDDFVAIDGATNGTRKLNAYSPSFGGGVTAGSTSAFGSTVDGDQVVLDYGNYIAGWAGIWLRRAGSKNAQNVSLASSANGLTVLNAPSGQSLLFRIGNVSQCTIDGTNTTVNSTTDSTSTSTGALVVSGGMGVAKTITAGGVIVNKAYTVATLPAAASYTYGTCAVSDAINAAGTGLGISPTGGGSVKRLVYSDGSNWLLL